METQERTMNENESFQLISQMINSTRRNLKEDGIIFLFWGYLALAACILSYSMDRLGYGDKSGWVWIILMPLGGIITGFLVSKKKKSQKVKTMIDSMMGYIWISFGLSMFLTIFTLSYYRYDNALAPAIIMLYGIATFTTGGLLKFKPLIWGGLSCWVLAAACLFIASDKQMAFICISLITSYIIPGHLLRQQNNN